MSRSVHTRPRRVLSGRRVGAPYESRGRSDLSSIRALGRVMKEMGLPCGPAPWGPSLDNSLPLPRLRVQDPGRDRIHPATRADVVAVLEYFGAEATYGLRTIELARSRGDAIDGLLLGRLHVPGRIVLYDQPTSPWLLPGRLPNQQMDRLETAGAEVEQTGCGRTWVTWPGETLKDFMLLDVLLHEIGHHVLQHYKGKRRARVARTRDHEASARAFAQRCRVMYLDGRAANR